MKRIALLVLLVGVGACRGKQGEKGDPGSFFSSGRVYSGTVSSNDQFIDVGAFDASEGDLAYVYVCKANRECHELNGDAAAAAYYVGATNIVILKNAQTAGFANYSITVANG